MIRLIDYAIAGPRTVRVTVTDGVHTQIRTAVEIDDKWDRTVRRFYAFGQIRYLVSELRYIEGEGTCSIAKVVDSLT